MEHRKRNSMQHKVELSALLRIAITNNKNRKFRNNRTGSQHLIKTLAAEAIISLKNCDRAVSDILIKSSDT